MGACPRLALGVQHPLLDEGIAAEKEAFSRTFASEDAREGIGAFLGKRQPTWSGR